MTDDHDSLEAELEALRPRPVSAGLARRIAGRFAGNSSVLPRATVRWGAPLVGGLVAAGLIALAILWRGATSIRGPECDVVPPTSPVVQGDEDWPTLQAYRRALAESPEALEALLDRHAATSAAAHRPPKALRSFLVADRNLLD